MLGVPVLKIGGVVLDCERFAWPLVAGPLSPEVGFEVSNTVDAELQKLQNPVSFHCDVTQVVDGAVKTSAYTVQRLFLVDRTRVDAFTVRWTIADERWLFKDVRFTAQFNVPRIVNEFLIPGFAGANQNFDTIARYKYKPNTLKKRSGNSFAKPTASPDSSDGTTWTALQAVIYALEVTGATTEGSAIHYVNEAKDNGYVLQRETFTEERFPSALARLLNLARANVYVDLTGTWKLFSVEDEPIKVPLGGYEGAGVVEVKDISRSVPGKIRVRFPPEYEIRWDYLEDATTHTSARDALNFNLDNVVQLPDSVIQGLAPGGGQGPGPFYAKGTWLTIDQALALWNGDGSNAWPNVPLTIDYLQRLFTSPALIAFFTIDGSGQVNSTLMNRVMALMTHYRQTFRIPAIWMNLIESWTTRLVNTIDVTTGERQPSPVYMDYTVIPTGRLETWTMRGTKLMAASQYAWPLSAPAGPQPLKDGTVCANARLQIVSQELGIFRVSFLPDLQFYVMRYLPCGLAKNVEVDLLKSPDAVNLTLEGTPAAANFRFATLLSMTFAAPNHSRRFHEISFGKSDGKRPHALDIPFMREPARFAWQDGASVARFNEASGLVELSGFQLINERTLIAIAEGYRRRAVFSYTSRVWGVFKRMGFDAALDRPRGNVRAVAPTFTDDGALETVYDMSEPPDAPDLNELLPPEVRRIVNHELEKPA